MRNQNNAELHCSRSDLTNYYYEIADNPQTIERHLQDCRTCTDVYRSISEDHDLVRDIYREEAMQSVDAGFYERETRRLMRRISETATNGSARPPRQRTLAWWRFAAVAVSLLVTLLIGSYGKHQWELKQLRAQAEAVVNGLGPSSIREEETALGLLDEKRPGFPTETEIRDSTDLLSEMD